MFVSRKEGFIVNDQEQLWREAVKQTLKNAVENNPTLMTAQKQYACKRLMMLRSKQIGLWNC